MSLDLFIYKLDTNVTFSWIYTVCSVLVFYYFGLTLKVTAALLCALTLSIGIKFGLSRAFPVVIPDKSAVLITGTSSGFGHDTALRLASEGVVVYCTIRKAADGEKLLATAEEKKIDRANLVPIMMDVTNDHLVKSAVSKIAEDLEKKGLVLTALVNNAGYGEFGPLELSDAATLHKQFDVNVYGIVRVTNAVLPLLRKAPVGTARIVNISSIAGSITAPAMGTYCASKHAVESLSDAYNVELSPWKIKVVVIKPGYFSTSFMKRAEATRADTWGAKSLESMEDKDVAEVYRKIGSKGQPPLISGHMDEVPMTIRTACFGKRPYTRYLVGKDAIMYYHLVGAVPPAFMKFVSRMMFWKA